MGQALGVVVSSQIVAGLVIDHQLSGSLRSYPENPDDHGALLEHPLESLCELICEQVIPILPKTPVEGIGIAIPGIVRGGVVDESPNLAQLKGAKIEAALSSHFQSRRVTARIRILNDADAVAAGLAATHGQMDRIIRVWTVGNGIGFGRYPNTEGVWEGGHMVVTLDSKETYCGCGGRGHLEGVMGHRAMRLRFLDMEPEEVFAAATRGDDRCKEFVRLWHRALAAATASSIHMGGPGRFYYTGTNIHFLNLDLLKEYLWQMVKMSTLQNYTLIVIPENKELAIIGAAADVLLPGR